MRLSRESTNLDVLRAIAVLLVYFSHLCGTLNLVGKGLYRHDIVGRVGVMFFFVHTFLVLLMSLDRSRLRGWAMTRQFYFRRLFRIYPLSILMVVIVVVLQIPAMPLQVYVPPSWPTLAANLALVQNIWRAPDLLGPLWSLPWEVQMYIVVPAVFVWLQNRPGTSAAWRLWAVVLAVRIVGWTTHVRVLAPLAYAPCFLAGAIAWKSLQQTTGRFSGKLWLVAIAASGLIYSWLRQVVPEQDIFTPAYVSCLALGVALPYFQDLPVSWFTRSAHYVAKYSYGIYLSHIPLMWAFQVPLADEPALVRWSFLLITSVLVPVALFHWVEDPLIQVGKRLTEVKIPGIGSFPQPAAEVLTSN